MNNQDILDKAPEGALGIKIMDGFYRWVLKDNTQSKIYGCEAFFDCNQIYRSLADIKHNVELEKEVVKANMKLIDCALDIAELEKELATSTPPPNLIWFDRSEVLGLDPEQTGVIDLRGMKLEQQAKGCDDGAKACSISLGGDVVVIGETELNDYANDLRNQAKALEEQGE